MRKETIKTWVIILLATLLVGLGVAYLSSNFEIVKKNQVKRPKPIIEEMVVDEVTSDLKTEVEYLEEIDRILTPIMESTTTLLNQMFRGTAISPHDPTLRTLKKLIEEFKEIIPPAEFTRAHNEYLSKGITNLKSYSQYLVSNQDSALNFSSLHLDALKIFLEELGINTL